MATYPRTLAQAATTDLSGTYADKTQSAPGRNVLHYGDHLSRWRARQADSRWARRRVAVFGNSIAKGQYSNNSGSTDEATWRERGWVGQVRSMLATADRPVGFGLIGMLDSRWTPTGTISTITSVGIGQGGKRMSPGSTLSITLPACTDINIHWWWQDNASSAAFSYSIDGKTPVVATAPSGTDLYPTESVTGLANRTHTLVITAPGSLMADISAVSATVGTSSGISISNISVSGGYVDNVFIAGTGTSATRLKKLSLVQPGIDLAVLAFGQNELGVTGQGLGYTPTSLATLISEVATFQSDTNGGSTLIIAGPRRLTSEVGSTYTEDAYYDALKDVASSQANTAFLDLRELWGTYAEANTAGLFYDGVHPNRTGHSDIAKAVFEAIGGSSASPLSTTAGAVPARPYQSGAYIVPPGAVTSAALTLGEVRATAIRVERTITIDRLGVDVTSAGTAGALLRAGLYASDANGNPTGMPLVDAGTVASDTTGFKEWTVALTLEPGFYHVALVSQVATCTVRYCSGISPWTYGAPTGTNSSGSRGATGVTGALDVFAFAFNGQTAYAGIRVA